MNKLESECGNYFAQISRYGRYVRAEIFRTNPTVNEWEVDKYFEGRSQLTMYDKHFYRFLGGDPTEQHWIDAKNWAINQLNLQNK